MLLSVLGSGYVGTTIAACFADLGHEVVNIDIDEEIVATINDDKAPIHEDGFSELLAKHAGSEGTGRLRARPITPISSTQTLRSSVSRLPRTRTGVSTY